MLNSAGRAPGGRSVEQASSSADHDGPDARMSDAALADGAGRGDTGAAKELVHRYYPKVYRLAHRMSDADADAAEERTQDVFLKIFAHIKGFRREAAFSTWVYRIAVRTCLDDRNRRKRWRRLLIPRPFGRQKEDTSDNAEDLADMRPSMDPESLLCGQQLDGAVRAAMETLTDKQRAIFHLKVFEELRISEIAVVMEMAEGTVKSHLFRATRSLRKRLTEWIDKE